MPENQKGKDQQKALPMPTNAKEVKEREERAIKLNDLVLGSLMNARKSTLQLGLVH
jgi:hypothetical protein